MKHLMVRYVVKPDLAGENERYIRAVFSALEGARAPGLAYASFKLPDGVTFMHIATLEKPEANPLLALPAFQEFTRAIKDRCVEPPATTVLEQIGGYHGLAR